MITPFYTHANEKGKACGILVNRGWIPKDFEFQSLHYNSENTGYIEGVLYTGDAKTKYSVPNEPTMPRHYRADPKELALICQLRNREEASKLILKMVDFNEEYKSVLPAAPSSEDLLKFGIASERHAAYASLWKYVTYFNILANTTLWLYV